MKPRTPTVLQRCSATLRRWLRHTWLSRVPFAELRRGWRALWGTAARSSTWPPPPWRPELELMESRALPNDVLGVLQWPLLFSGIALVEGNLLTPASVLAYGWLGPRGSAGSPPVAHPGSDATGLTARWPEGAPARFAELAPTAKPELDFSAAPNLGNAVSSGLVAPASASPAFDRRELPQVAEDLLHNPLGDDWLGAVEAALSSRERGSNGSSPSEVAPHVGGAGDADRSAVEPGSSVTAPEGSSFIPAPTVSPLPPASEAVVPPDALVLSPGTLAPPGRFTPAGASAGSSAGPSGSTGSLPTAGGGSTAPGGTDPLLQDPPTDPALASLTSDYGRMPLGFEANVGQTDPTAQFLAHGSRYTAFLTATGPVLTLQRPQTPSQPNDPLGKVSVSLPVEDVLGLQLLGSDPTVQGSGQQPLPTDINYLLGNDPNQWHVDVPDYGQVTFPSVYPGIDLVFHGTNLRQTEADFIVAPGADPSLIQWSVTGAQTVQLDGQGNLQLTTPAGTLTEEAPVIYQDDGGAHDPVTGQYVLQGTTVSIQLGTYDPTLPLIIDPILDYSTFLGGLGTDQGHAIAVDQWGQAYVTGQTSSTDFPTNVPYQGTLTGSADAFINKFTVDGRGLIYSTYLGGGGNDYGNGIAVDGSGNACVAGTTTSGNFPLHNAFQGALTGGQDAFVAKLSSTGSSLVYSSYLGGSSPETGTAIAVDSSGDAYVTGQATSTNFPTLNAFQTSLGSANTNAFVTEVAPGGTLVYSSYLGGSTTGSATDSGTGIAVDSNNNAYVTGYTGDSNFPTVSPYQANLSGVGAENAFVSKVAAGGGALSYSTYFGQAVTEAQAIAVDSSGDAYITGWTSASSLPTLHPLQGGYAGNTDAFVTEFSSSGSALVYSTYLGGTGTDQATGIGVDPAGDAFVTGFTNSTNFPTTTNAFQTALGGSGAQNAFVTGIATNGATYVYSSYLGGTGIDSGNGIAVDGTGAAYVTGYTSSPSFPLVFPPFQGALDNSQDAFVTKVDGVLGGGAFGDDPQTALLRPWGLDGFYPLTGGLTAEMAGTADGHVLDCGCDRAANMGGQGLLVYNSNTVAVQPIIGETLKTAGAVPQLLQVRLTWDGTPQSWVNFQTTGHSAGDSYALAQQVASPVTSSGLHYWKFEVKVTPATGAVYTMNQEGIAGVIATDTTNTNDPAYDKYGAGWGVASAAKLVTGSTPSAGPFGDLWFSGTGQTRFWQSLNNGKFLNPINEFATLQQTGNTTIYTTEDQTVWTFNSSGQLVTIRDPHGVGPTFSGDAYQLSSITAPDGGVANFNYTGGLLSTISLPGSRTVTVTHGGNAVTVIQNADGGLRSFTYDGSNRLQTERWGPFVGTVAYSGTGVSQITLASGSTLSLAPSSAWGLATSPAHNAPFRAVLTDALSQLATIVQDKYGQPVQWFTPDGGVSSWTRDFAGQATTYTDPLGLPTNYLFNYSPTGLWGDLTKITFADTTTNQFQYDSTFHHLVAFTDANDNTTTSGLDSVTGDVLTIKDALGHVTSLAYYQVGGKSIGLLQSITDPLSHVVTFVFDTTTRRRLATVDPLGNRTSYGYDAAGNVNTVTDALGRVTSVVYDGLRRPLTVTTPDGGVTSVVYDALGDVLTTTDPLGHVTSIAYDARALPTTWTEAVGTAQQRTSTVIYDVLMRVLSATNPLGQTGSFAYDPVGRVTQAIDAYGSSVQRSATMIYDLDGNVLSATTGIAGTNPHRSTTTFAYDNVNQLKDYTEAVGTAVQRRATMIYDPNGNLLSETTGIASTNPQVVVTSYGYDALNRLTQVTEGYGGSVSRTSTVIYDAAGNVLSTTDPFVGTTSYAYDADNRVTQEIDALGSTVQRSATIIYDAVSRVVSETTGIATTNPNVSTTSYAYDVMDRVTQVINAYGTAIQRSGTAIYDKNSNLISATDPRGTTTSYLYDALDRTVQVIEAYGTSLQRTSSVVYDAGDNVLRSIDRLGFTVTMTYDALNRLATSQDPGGGITSMTYDAADNVLTVTDPLNHTTSYAYDALDRTTKVTDARGGVTSATYDAADNTLTLTDPVGNTTTIVHDLLGRQTQVTDPHNHSATYAYDGGDRLTSSTDRLGRQISFRYDTLGRETGETWTASGSNTKLITYTYDAADNLLTAASTTGSSQTLEQYNFTYDALDRPTQVTEPWSQTLTFAYDANDNRTLMKDSKSGVTTYVYDALNRLTSEQFTGQTTLRIDLSWTTRDQLAGISRYTNLAGTASAGTASYTYDGAMRLTNLVQRDASGNSLANYTYTFDLASRLTSETANGSTTSYQYDATNELTQAGTPTYSYDLAGNRTLTGYQTTTGNEMTNDGTWTYTYDAEGNIIKKSKGASADTWTYGYDDKNHLTSAVEKATDGGTTLTVATYLYDAFDNLTEEDVWTQSSGTTTVTRYAYDGANQWADLSNTNGLQMRHLYGPGANQVLARVSSTGTAAWYLTDWMGSVRQVLNAAGTMVLDQISYDGFGKVTSESSPTSGDRFKYAGGQVDTAATGYVRYGERYYDPATGRWTTQDPLGFASGDSNPYSYVSNGPTNWTDPTGLSPWIPSIPSASSVLGNLAGDILGLSPDSAFRGLVNSTVHTGISTVPVLGQVEQVIDTINTGVGLINGVHAGYEQYQDIREREAKGDTKGEFHSNAAFVAEVLRETNKAQAGTLGRFLFELSGLDAWGRQQAESWDKDAAERGRDYAPLFKASLDATIAILTAGIAEGLGETPGEGPAGPADAAPCPKEPVPEAAPVEPGPVPKPVEGGPAPKNAIGEDVGQPGETVRRFDSKRAVKEAKKNGIEFDPEKGRGIPTTTTDIDPVNPDKIKEITGADNADAYIDIKIENKKVLRRTTKAGQKEIVILEDIKPEDIIDSGRTRKSRLSPDD
jgi:RHS repeat-associated protein